MNSDDISKAAIKQAIRALYKRHLLEEGAHAPAIAALARPFAAQGLEWKEKAEKLELELQQCYKAQSRLSEQLVVEVAECRSSKLALQEKEPLISALQNEMTQASEENSKLKESLDEKTEALDLAMAENQSLKAHLEDAMQTLKESQAENKSLIDRWMLEKMKDAEKLNEVNAMYDEMIQQLKVNSIKLLAQQQVDGVIRQHEAGYIDSVVPSSCKHSIQAHDGGCNSILFDHNSNRLITGGHDRTLKLWDASTATLTSTLRGSLGSVLDLALTPEDKFLIAATSSNSLFVFEPSSGRIRHTLSGHSDKVCGVAAARNSGRHIVSAAYDHTVKTWDLHKGYCVHTIISISNCNAIAYTSDGLVICSGHVDGNLRLWDAQSGKMMSEVAAHSQAVTSVSVSHGGNFVLTSGRDNTHNLFDARTLEICGSYRDNGKRMATNWSRSCISGDENCVAAGYADGTISVWSRVKGEKMSLTEAHSAAVLCCAFNGGGRALASADRNGTVCIWE